jgi:hypothetical protein
MSSMRANLSASDLDMIKFVLDDAGYDADLLSENQRAFNAAAILLMSLFEGGMTSPAQLSIELERQFGRLSQVDE